MIYWRIARIQIRLRYGVFLMYLSSVLLTVLLTEFVTIWSIHQTFTVYQDIAILPTKSLDSTLDHTFGCILAFSSLDSTLEHMGDSLK